MVRSARIIWRGNTEVRSRINSNVGILPDLIAAMAIGDRILRSFRIGGRDRGYVHQENLSLVDADKLPSASPAGWEIV